MEKKEKKLRNSVAKTTEWVFNRGLLKRKLSILLTDLSEPSKKKSISLTFSFNIYQPVTRRSSPHGKSPAERRDWPSGLGYSEI